MPRLPKMLVADTEQAIDHNQTVAYLKSLRPMKAAGMHTTHGIHGVLRKPSQKLSRVRGMMFRGEYDEAENYNPQDVVVIRAGANAGSYVCIQSTNGNAPTLPDIGNQYWINLNGNSPVGGAFL